MCHAWVPSHAAVTCEVPSTLSSRTHGKPSILAPSISAEAPAHARAVLVCGAASPLPLHARLPRRGDQHLRRMGSPTRDRTPGEPAAPLQSSPRRRLELCNNFSFQTKRTGKGVIIAGTGRAGGPGSRESTNTGKAEAKNGEGPKQRPTVNPTRFRIGLVEIESRILTVRPLCSAVGVR